MCALNSIILYVFDSFFVVLDMSVANNQNIFSDKDAFLPRQR